MFERDEMIIEVNKLSKSYPGVLALNELTFSVPEGEVFGVIGPDGAGKTTLFRILTTLLLPDSGTARVVGFDTVSEAKHIRRALGYMPGKFSLYQDLTVEENLKFFASIFNTTVEENYGLIREIYVQLEPFKKRRAGKLSGGMKQKLALCCALIHKPRLLVLDEPTTGVDAVSRKEFWDMLGRLRQQGISIIVSTPYMDEAGRCDRVALMQTGNFLRVGAPEQIVREFSRKVYGVFTQEKSSMLRFLKQSGRAHSAFSFGESIHYIDKNSGASAPEIETFVRSSGIANFRIELITPDIEDVFIDLMGVQENG